MSADRAGLPTYHRSMSGWWRHNPHYRRYMLREGTALLLLLYALVLLAGLYSLAQGEPSWLAWRAAVATPGALLFHAIALCAALYHSITWFAVLPATAPDLPVPAQWLTRAALAASAGLSLLLLATLWWAMR